MSWERCMPWTLSGLVLLLLVTGACSGEASFQGRELDSPDVAPPFELQDQFANPVSLSDFAGKVVALTFLYTYCPDVCPLTTETLRRTQELLGEDASDVQFLAISVDPPRDTVERAYEYSQEKAMLDKWHYLVGTEEQLAPVWTSYWLDPYREIPGEDAGSSSNDSGEEEQEDGEFRHSRISTSSGALDGGYLIGHSAPVLLIDREGFRRVLFTELTLDYQPLLHDIRLLLR